MQCKEKCVCNYSNKTFSVLLCVTRLCVLGSIDVSDRVHQAVMVLVPATDSVMHVDVIGCQQT